MAECTELKELPRLKYGGPPKYDKFFDGAVWRLTLGVDTKAKNTTHARTAIYDRARALGIRVSVHVESESTLLVQKTGER